ncbi:hypothetical protein [Haliscomenobacter hydrossis]|uniref:Uncharacterized protein n=1 Tax=Haliscomenobacter hydrossis (strain ATCC 27775 / DSM 1100 / LMG 10767 / O) TaxID=760192 RepID=F4KZ36_HALH1|nr:hypothetical protein [Haliscomenobacter hydrossis]AEE53690.1 hypothetical protein Halhy_5867 [Haliscomenobacter hydrossis DSM 1100]
MPNTYGNIYPAWGINTQNQVFAVDTGNAIFPMSDENFAEVIAISESGVIWVLSTDPDTGGALLYWGIGDGNWNPATTASGAIFLSGFVGNQAWYYTEDGALCTIDITGEGEVIGKIADVQQMDYGGGYLWLVFPSTDGGIPCLQFSPINGAPFAWKPFVGFPEPSCITVNYTGNCYGIDGSFSPMYYLNDGVSTGSAGDGANGSALEISFKNTYFLLSTNADKNGNDVLMYQDTAGSSFVSAGFQAIQVLGTYYVAPITQ